MQLESQSHRRPFVGFLLRTMANKKYLFTCPACAQTKVTVVCKGFAAHALSVSRSVFSAVQAVRRPGSLRSCVACAADVMPSRASVCSRVRYAEKHVCRAFC